jgi:hypothetical protein
MHRNPDEFIKIRDNRRNPDQAIEINTKQEKS